MEKHDNRPALPKKLYDQIEKDVVKLHIKLELSVPVNPSEVAKRLGYIVHKFSEIYSEGNNLIELRTGNDGNRRDGLSYYDPDVQTYVIWVNDIDSIYEEHDGFTVSAKYFDGYKTIC